MIDIDIINKLIERKAASEGEASASSDGWHHRPT